MKKPDFLVVAVLALSLAACRPPAPPSLTAPEIRKALFAELQPVALKNCTMKRYGSTNDGGYLMCENLVEGVASAYSYGIDTEDNWGCDVSKQLKIPVHQYDCFTEHRPVCTGGQFVFHDECVGAVKETKEGQVFDTIAGQIEKNGDTGKQILLKIDVEGAEWHSLMATPDEVLDRIVQLPMELHGTNEERFLETLRKLKKTFHVVNLHYNNWVCTGEVAPLLSTAYQVLLVNKRVGVLDPSVAPPAPPSPLNAPDNARLGECGPVGP